MIRRRYSVEQVMDKLKNNPNMKLYHRERSITFHSGKECPMLNNGQFEHYSYKEISLQEINQKKLYPDTCVYKSLGMN